ncbi:MAG: hypothetical protein OEZ34_07445, partial [Spirochaetia bacterium]|nr:hypothetical protein [Spirochaetia bacterium]
KEFEIFPIVILAMTVLGVLVGFTGKHRLFLAWFILMLLLSLAGLVDFYIWEYDYGHNLNPNAILKFTNEDGTPMGFQPPVFGSKHILNFVAHSYPSSGAFALFLSLALAFISYKLGGAAVKEEKESSL